MDRSEFDAWFRANIDMMVEQGVMHPNSPWGRTVKLALTVTGPQIAALTERVEALEKQAASLTDLVPPTKPKRKKKDTANG